ncbi:MULTISPECIES: type II toxin-antitoxin system VapC family toxin [Cysteiniphilum]|uniref:type II toxin-antitoxin system VapC family toxin n=1 Tax=Cysteiniphilum TaxID=2056696 RepID=UPI001783C6B5|nr:MULTISPECIES: type II toxin-antitoxin system VapC family toxin [Cysteiniphilum]
MKYILDTHILLWAASGSKKLSLAAKKIINNTNNQLFFSVASIWEVAIKQGLARDDFQVDARLLRRALIDNGYSELPILSEHVVEVNTLPMIHKDPFDRILIAQSMVEGIILMTADESVCQYNRAMIKKV